MNDLMPYRDWDKLRKERRRRWRKFHAPDRNLGSFPHSEFKPDLELLLWADNEFFTGGAVYRRQSGQWSCVRTAPCLKFLLKKTPPEAKFELAQRGYTWKWISPLSEGNAVAVSPTDQGDLSRVTNYGARSTNVPANRGKEVSVGIPATAALQH